MRGKAHTIISALGGLELGLTLHPGPLPMAAGVVAAAIAGKMVDIDEPNSNISRTISPPAGILRIGIFLVAVYASYFLYTHPGWQSGKEIYQTIAYGICGLIGCFSLIAGEGMFRRVGITLISLTTSFIVWKLDFPTAYMIPGIVIAVVAWLPHRWAVHTPVAAAGWGAMIYAMMLPFPYAVFITEAAVLGFVLHLAADTLTDHGVMWLWPITKKKISLRLMRTGTPMGNVVEMIVIAVMVGIVDYRHFGILKGFIGTVF